MKYLRQLVIVLVLLLTIGPGRAAILVSNVWNTTVRTYPTYNNVNSPYSEMGVDYNASGDFESAWFSSSSSALTVPAAGDLRAVQPTTSLTMMTYFTPEGSEVNLAGIGDLLKITWVFKPATVNSANTSQGLPIAVVNTPSGSRLTADNSPPSAAYTGYAMFINVGQTLGGSTPFQLKKWSVASGNLLSSSGSWTTALANGVTSGVHGFDSGTTYTFTLTLTHNAANGLDISSTMSGGTYNNTGTGTVAFTDATPGSFLFDTFALRPTGSAATVAQWDASLFKVEFIPGSTPPVITQDLANQAASVGQNVTFSLLAGGSVPLSYQWYYNTNFLLNGQTNSLLTLTNVQLADAGGYSVVVTNASGAVTSIVAQLTVSVLPPTIDFDPQDQSVFVGQDTSLSVQASGTAPLSYQWYYHTNTVLTGQTNSVLYLANAQLPDTGGYSVVVTNESGSVTSAVAQLTVSLPVAPSIISQPQDLTGVLPGATATFNVTASGSDPLSYQWFYNNSILLTNATDSILTLTNVQPGNAGSYSVVVNNLAGAASSSNALLTVNTGPVAPVFNSQPASQVVLAGSAVGFTAVAGGTAPISYQWNKNGTPIPGATAATLSLTNVSAADTGNYTLTASNSVGQVTSNPAQLTVTTSIPLVNSAYNLVGFGQAATGGGLIAETNPAYAKVTNALQLANAVLAFNKTGGIKVIEIMNDLDLGWNEIGAAVQTLGSTPFTAAATPQLHPRLITTGVSKLDIKYKNGGLTIFSANGATIRHGTFNIKSTHNIIIRNLKFDEMWEWDEATKGQYDKNDWDFIDLSNGGDAYDVWIDHCTFTKSYDGIVDMKAGTTNVTLSWCKYTGDDGATNTNSFVWQQINALESNKTAHVFYNFLRNNGFSPSNIVQIIQGHDKAHLMGSNDKDPNNVNLSATFHHQWMRNCWDRAVPRLRAGNVHDFNILVDDTEALAARRLRNTIQATMSSASSNTLNHTYSFNPPLNGSIATEGGAVLVEKSVYIDCLYPLRNNQTAPSDPTYTGKILGLDIIYQLDNTVIRGNSTNSGSPLGPFQAPLIAFSWNPASGAPDGQLPYTCTPDDPAQLQAMLTSPTTGAGAGVLTWNKTNWLKTAYAPTAPLVVSQPQNLAVTTNQSAIFTVVAGGSANLSYQWYFNTNTVLLNATNPSLTLVNVQVTHGGSYSVTVTNSAGSVTSTNATLIVSTVTTANPQVSASVFANGSFSLSVNGDTGHDYIIQGSTNLSAWNNLYTNHAAAFNWSDLDASNFNQRYYRVLRVP